MPMNEGKLLVWLDKECQQIEKTRSMEHQKGYADFWQGAVQSYRNVISQVLILIQEDDNHSRPRE